MAQLSILISATSSQQRLEQTLVSVLENRPSDCEIVVVHSASFIDHYDLSDEVRFVLAEGTCELAMINAGLAACQGQVIHILLPGCRVSEDWCHEPLELFDHDSNLAVVVPRLKVGKRRVVRGVQYRVCGGRRIVQRAAANALVPTLMAGFYKASALRFMNGLNETFGVLADVELGLRLRCAGYSVARSEASKIEVDKLPRISLPKGYLGGQLRARLFRTARRTMTVSNSSLSSLLSEIPFHWCGPRSISGILGQISVWLQRTEGTTLPMEMAGSSRSRLQRKAV